MDRVLEIQSNALFDPASSVMAACQLTNLPVLSDRVDPPINISKKAAEFIRLGEFIVLVVTRF